MKRIEKLTKEQEAMLPVWRDKWIEIGLKTGETDWETFGAYMPICYQKVGLEYPKRVVRVSSPLVGALASSIANRILNSKDKSGAVGGAVGDAVRDAVRGAVGDAVDGAVGDAVREAVRDAKLKWHYWLGGQFWVGGWWYGSPSYISFFTDVCKLELDIDIQERATAYRKICESVNYIWANKDFVMVCARPKVISRNINGRLHLETGKAIEYPDGWGLYFLNGVRFDEELFKKVTSKTMKFEDILAIQDIDQRTQAMRFGDVKQFLAHTKAEQLDSYIKYRPDNTLVHYSLHKIKSGEIFRTDAYYMVYDCPSTGQTYMSGVEPCKTVAEAMAWKMSDDNYTVTPKNWESMLPLIHEA